MNPIRHLPCTWAHNLLSLILALALAAPPVIGEVPGVFATPKMAHALQGDSFKTQTFVLPYSFFTHSGITRTTSILVGAMLVQALLQFLVPDWAKGLDPKTLEKPLRHFEPVRGLPYGSHPLTFASEAEARKVLPDFPFETWTQITQGPTLLDVEMWAINEKGKRVPIFTFGLGTLSPTYDRVELAHGGAYDVLDRLLGQHFSGKEWMRTFMEPWLMHHGVAEIQGSGDLLFFTLMGYRQDGNIFVKRLLGGSAAQLAVIGPMLGAVSYEWGAVVMGLILAKNWFFPNRPVSLSLSTETAA